MGLILELIKSVLSNTLNHRKIITYFFTVDTITNVLISPILPASTHPLPLFSGCHHALICVYELCMYVIWLTP